MTNTSQMILFSIMWIHFCCKWNWGVFGKITRIAMRIHPPFIQLFYSYMTGSFSRIPTPMKTTKHCHSLYQNAWKYVNNKRELRGRSFWNCIGHIIYIHHLLFLYGGNIHVSVHKSILIKSHIIKAARLGFNTPRHSAQCGTKITFKQRRFILVNSSCLYLLENNSQNSF